MQHTTTFDYYQLTQYIVNIKCYFLHLFGNSSNNIKSFVPELKMFFVPQMLYFFFIQKYEEEIAQMEKMRGMDVKFVNPEVKYCCMLFSAIISVSPLD